MDRRNFIAAGATAPFALGALTGNPELDTPRIAEAMRESKTRFAVNVEMWWGRERWIDRVKRAVAFGYPAIEFWPWARKPIDELLGIMDTSGLEVAQFLAWGFSPGLNDPKNHDRFEKAIEDSIKTAHRLRCKKMTVIAGNDRQGVSREEMHGHVITGLKRVAKMCEEADVMLILEPLNTRVDHKGHCLDNSPDSVRICEEVGSTHVKINWDLYHLQIMEGDLCGRMKDGYEQVGYFQLADHPGRGHPGTGEIHYPRVFRAAHELGYRDYFGLECRPMGGEFAATQNILMAGNW